MQGSNRTESICEYTAQCLKVESFTYTNFWIRIVNNTIPDGLEHPPIHNVASSKYVVTMNHSNTKLTMPVLALGGGYIPTVGGNITMPSTIYAMNILAQNVTGISVPNSGFPEEQPQFVIDQLVQVLWEQF